MEWFVKEGDKVKEMDRLCLVESDKASVEITSRYTGTVKSIKAPVHENAKVGSVILEIDEENGQETGTLNRPTESIKAEAPVSDTGTPLPSTKQQSSTSKQWKGHENGNKGSKAIPSVRALAQQLGIDLSKVRGSGKDGRITEQDVRSASKLQQHGISRSTEESGKAKIQYDTKLESFGDAKEVKLSQVGLAMVKSMNESLKVPQLNHADEIDVGRLVDIIQALKPTALSDFSLQNLTLTAFFIKAVSLGIDAFPIVNSRLSTSQESYHLIKSHNVSVAMDSPRGLVVPNIKNVDQMSIVEIQKALIELHGRARNGRLSPDDIKNGTISFSNIGVIGGTYAKPVIFDGQSVIGAVGRVQTLPRFDDRNKVVPTKIVNVGWTADHRHVDGATVARFSNVFKQVIQEPEKMIAMYFK
jgi:2-oxoisovalerate dehydrogenase E2 component (dihydrolipoyl transacylase)